MHEKAISQIAFEIEQIDALLDSYSELLQRAQANTPDLIEITALASVLHSFYNGLENIFLTVAKRIDQHSPDTDRWHRDLLAQMTQTTSKRDQVLTTELADRLADYLAFRHFYRHSYSFFLEWDELETLIAPLEDLWNEVKAELETFIEEMKK